MLENTTRSATVVFRFIIYFGEVFRKAPYAIRVRCPNRPVRASSDIGWFLLGFPAPLPGAARKGLRTIPCKVLGLVKCQSRSDQNCHSLQPGDGCHWAHPPLSKINLRRRSPPRALAGKENSFLTTYEYGRQVYKRRTRDDTSSA